MITITMITTLSPGLYTSFSKFILKSKWNEESASDKLIIIGKFLE